MQIPTIPQETKRKAPQSQYNGPGAHSHLLNRCYDKQLEFVIDSFKYILHACAPSSASLFLKESLNVLMLACLTKDDILCNCNNAFAFSILTMLILVLIILILTATWLDEQV